MHCCHVCVDHKKKKKQRWFPVGVEERRLAAPKITTRGMGIIQLLPKASESSHAVPGYFRFVEAPPPAPVQLSLRASSSRLW
ncbi:hypothetical protein JOB18_036397, partial [Solea senegalensis]